MKTTHLFIFPFLLLLPWAGSSISYSHKNDMDNLNFLRKEVEGNLKENLLPFWAEKVSDSINGGFYGRVDASGKVYPGEDKGGILNARILWTFSSAFRVLGDTVYLRMAKREKDYIMNHFIDNKYGGAYRSVTAQGEPSDTRKQTYTQAFFIYALAEYYRATGEMNALEAAKNIYRLFEKYALDPEYNGYFEVFTRDWKRTNDRLIGETSEKDEKSMNTHLHVLEAYAGLYRVWPDAKLAVRLRSLIDMFLNNIINKNTAHLNCFFDRQWNSTSETDSYGHDIESSWLLYEAAKLLDDPTLEERVKSESMKIVKAASEGLQPDGSMIYETNRSTGHVNNERSWWVQAEAVTGYLNAYELTGDDNYLQRSVKCWQYINGHLVDNKNGGWFSTVSNTEGKGTGDKAGFWICPYHNSRMCLEVIERTRDK
jgi:mannobiose 2-epimerase